MAEDCPTCMDPWNCPLCIPGRPGVRRKRRLPGPAPTPQLEIGY